MSQTYPFSIYKPTNRFVEISKWEFSQDVWDCLTKDENVRAMLVSINCGESPLIPLDSELNSTFSNKIINSGHNQEELRIMCLNMMKQFLEYLGYKHTACCLIPKGEFVRSAGVYKKDK